MPIATAKSREMLECSHCGDDIYACSECLVDFDDGQEIFCHDTEMSEGHYCLTCIPA